MAAKRRSPREYGDDFKCQIVSESYEAGASVSDLSRHHDVPTRQIYAWRSDVRYQPNNCGDRDVRFLEVAVGPEPSTLSVESIHGRECIEITLENGRRLSVSDGVNAEFVLELARGLAA